MSRRSRTQGTPARRDVEVSAQETESPEVAESQQATETLPVETAEASTTETTQEPAQETETGSDTQQETDEETQAPETAETQAPETQETAQETGQELAPVRPASPAQIARALSESEAMASGRAFARIVGVGAPLLTAMTPTGLKVDLSAATVTRDAQGNVLSTEFAIPTPALVALGVQCSRMGDASDWSVLEVAAELKRRLCPGRTVKAVLTEYAETVGRDYQTIANGVNVIEAFPVRAERVGGLSISHHMEVAGPGWDKEKRYKALLLCRKGNGVKRWSVAQFRMWLRAQQEKLDAGEESALAVPADSRPRVGAPRTAQLPAGPKAPETAKASETAQAQETAKAPETETAEAPANPNTDSAVSSGSRGPQAPGYNGNTEPAKATGPVPGSSSDKTVRPLVLPEDMSGHLIRIAGSVSRAEELLIAIVSDWLSDAAKPGLQAPAETAEAPAEETAQAPETETAQAESTEPVPA